MESGYSNRSPLRSICLGLLLVLFLVSTLAVGTAGAQNWTDMKLLIHLQPVGELGACVDAPTSLGCNGNSSVVVDGALNTDYYAYIVAANIDPALGLSEASFGIYYHPEDLTGLTVTSWTSCANGETPGASWPDPGSSIDLRFTSCQGATADPADTEGRGMAVLGSLVVSAESNDDLVVIRRFDADNAPATVKDCSNTLYYVDAISNGGIAGFGYESGTDPCTTIIDRFPTACCLSEGCQSLDPLYCDYLGGVPLFDPVQQVNCSPSACVAPVVPTTWGRIKALYH